jgi:hypothetical protein
MSNLTSLIQDRDELADALQRVVAAGDQFELLRGALNQAYQNGEIEHEAYMTASSCAVENYAKMIQANRRSR